MDSPTENITASTTPIEKEAIVGSVMKDDDRGCNSEQAFKLFGGEAKVISPSSCKHQI
jgi:hypothetical protein